MSTHAVLGASGMGIWSVCGGYYQAAAGIPDTPSSAYAAEGTVAHSVLEHLLTTGRLSQTGLVEEDGHQIHIDEDMLTAVETAYATLRPYQQCPQTICRVEEQVKIESLGLVYDVDLFGTCDFIAWNPVEGVLTIADYKHGKGVPVKALDNLQIRYYAVGAVETLKISWSQLIKVELIILQPRVYDEPQIEVIYGLDLKVWYDEVLNPAVSRAVSDGAPLVAGDHCRWCRVKPTCPEVRKSVMETAKTDFSDVSAAPPVPNSLSDDELGAVLNKADMIASWVAAVRGEASNRIDRGRTIPGWKLVEKRAVRKWTDVDEVLKWLRSNSYGGDTPTVTTAPVSPAQLEKLARRHEKEHGVFVYPDHLVKKESSGTTLVPADDPRPAAEVGPSTDFAPVLDPHALATPYGWGEYRQTVQAPEVPQAVLDAMKAQVAKQQEAQAKALTQILFSNDEERQVREQVAAEVQNEIGQPIDSLPPTGQAAVMQEVRRRTRAILESRHRAATKPIQPYLKRRAYRFP